MRKQRHLSYDDCPVEATLDVISGKWKGVILFRLVEQPRRFNELRRLLPNVSQRVLTTQLRDLEGDGLINRRIFAEVPPRVEYSLTPLGRTLEPLLREMKRWGEAHLLPPQPGGSA